MIKQHSVPPILSIIIEMCAAIACAPLALDDAMNNDYFSAGLVVVMMLAFLGDALWRIATKY